MCKRFSLLRLVLYIMDSAKKRIYESTWSRLETALNNEECYTPGDSRPKTTHSVRKYSPNNRFPRSIDPLRSCSVSKSCRSRIKRPATASFPFKKLEVVHGLTLLQIQQIYAAKCQDLGIPVLADQEKRFISCSAQHFFNRKFVMKESGLGEFSAEVIGNILSETQIFAHVDLSKNLLKDIGAIKVAKKILKSLCIFHLDLSSNEISPEGCETLIGLLSNHMSLASLNLCSHEGLHRNRLAMLGASAIGKLLSTSPVLSFLNISGTGIGPEGLESIIKGLSNNLVLTSLNLSNNNLGKGIEKLAYAVAGTDLKELNLGTNKIGNEGAEFIAQMLSGGFDGYCTVIKLDLSDNDITTTGLSKLFDALRINSQVNNLNLKKNHFSRGLSENLTQFLVENVTLERMDLSFCEIECLGLVGIGEGLAKNVGLKHLYLNSNTIKDKGAGLVANGLSKNQNLKHLDLSNNKIKDKGGIDLAKAVSVNDSLQVLELKNNSLKDESGQLFSEITRYKHNILKLNLETNPLNFKYLETIKKNLKTNQEHQQKLVVPKLLQILERIQFRDDAMIELNQRILQKEKERAEVENKLKNQGLKLEDIKNIEESKIIEVKNEYASLREISQKLSKEIEDITNQINVVFI